MKSILLHVQDDPSLDRRLDAALALARACGGHLGCLHVTPVEAYVAMDSFGGVFVMQEMLTAIDDAGKCASQAGRRPAVARRDRLGL